MKDKIGLVTAHHVTNYGALLQSYAMQQVIKTFGFKTEIIDYKAFRLRRGINLYISLIPFLWNQFKDSRKLKKINSQRQLDQLHKENRVKRIEKKKKFEESKLENIKVYEGIDALRKASESCDAVLIGSDQMWTPGTSFTAYQSLRFVKKGIRKISYATSLGVSQYPRYCYDSARDMWKSFDFLSVREQQGADIIKEISPETKVKVVCDPTYLLTKQQWNEKIPVKKLSSEKYVLCYFLGNSDQQMMMARDYAKLKGVKCYTILSDESECSCDTTFADKLITGASVEDFINWIRGAECVITDSFHGLAFSVINEKDFFIFYRRKIGVGGHRNARIDNILDMWKLQDRLILPEKNEIPDLPSINYGIVNTLVENKRRDSYEYLKEALTF